MLKKLNKILVANRGEIAIRILRAISELNIQTVAVYTYEDRYSLHRYKADEAYQIGPDDEPLKPYLDIEEIINLAKKKNVHAIHPGYGFLSENVTFARRCEEEGIIFIGPRPEVMERLGNKIKAKQVAREANIPIIDESRKDLKNVKIAVSEANRIGYPVMTKAASGGGGRGMRVCHNDEQLSQAFTEARSEALKSFGDDTIFLEKYIDSPKHIEVQIMADLHGNMVHLFERDCSVQRRFQKVVEIAPSQSLSQEVKEKIYQYALDICKHVNYNNLGTVEFLVDKNENIFFIEVNPRIQVEHTITEEITGIDLVRSQILIAKGVQLHDELIYIKSQDDVKCNGFAIQCRITTEDPSQNFKPDYGTVIAYRSAAGFGIRLDIGNCYTGAKISPFFDPMLVKISASGRTLHGTAKRMHRALREFRIRGVKTNVDFLLNVISNETFKKGKATVKFIDNHPALFKMPRRLDRGTKALRFLAEITVNGNPSVKDHDENKTFRTPKIPDFDKYAHYPKGTKNILSDLGRDRFCSWLKKEKAIQFTDTTFRDAHQSLLATRVRPFDMLKVAESFAKNCPNVFSMEVWGGATFDVSMRFLFEDPWVRLQRIREAVPNILLQMLLRGSNAVGYKAYPDNLIEKFVEEAAKSGIDIFRIFDSLNWVEAMKVSIKAVRERTESLAEACICYTGNFLNKDEKKYTLEYYLSLAKELEDEGAHILAIKDMAGLLNPYAAERLIKELKQVVDIPIHLHTHDTSSVQAATYLKAIEAGVDVVDVALASMSGLTSQPNFNAIAAYMDGQPRQADMNLDKLNEFSAYWEDVREFYYPFESGLKAGTAEVYEHEIPGGQYSNLRPQAIALGLGDQFEQIKKNYVAANELFGNLVKVTPSSKVVGDFALYMTANGLSKEDILEKGKTLSFPESAKSMMRGELGQAYQGFPKTFQKIVLKDEKPFSDRPNAHLAPIDFEKGFEEFNHKFPNTNFLEYLSYLLYPKVFEDYYNHYQRYNDVSKIPTLPFLYGMKVNEEVLIELSEGKTLIVKLLYVSSPDEEGKRSVHFEMNGQNRKVRVKDQNVQSTKIFNQKAGDSENEIGSPLQGRIASVLVKKGDPVKPNQALFVIEAMKMETTVTAPVAGKISKVILSGGTMVEQDDLVVVLEY
jgi:pyruvate carboxylase